MDELEGGVTPCSLHYTQRLKQIIKNDKGKKDLKVWASGDLNKLKQSTLHTLQRQRRGVGKDMELVTRKRVM